MKLHGLRLVALAAALSLATSAHAAFHVTQVEQIIGGVGGDTNAQAIQLRMRMAGEVFMSNARIKAWDAAGLNPVVIVAMNHTLTNGSVGDHTLIASAGMAADLAIAPDFTMTNVIPASYLAAGSLTFEDNFNTVYWRVSWGGAAYTGPGTVNLTNDADGNANPAFASALPSATSQALLYPGAATGASTNSSTDYALTAGAATFTNNHRDSAPIVNVAAVPEGPGAGAVQLGRPAPNPVTGMLSYSVTLARESHVTVAVYDLRGRRVSLVADRTLGAGKNALNWNASAAALGSGLYFLRLDAAGVQRSQKFTLVH